MSEYNQFKELIDLTVGVVDMVTDVFNDGVNVFSPDRLEEKLDYEYKECKRKCRIVRIVVLIVCGIIIYFHFRGIG